jgi:hypothetical protein
MIRGIIGLSSGLQPLPVRNEEEEADEPSSPLPQTDADSMAGSDPDSDADVMTPGVEPEAAAQLDATVAPGAPTPPVAESHGVLPKPPWQKLAELENMGRPRQEPYHLDFAGNLETAGDIAVTFQLASEGKLELMNVPGRCWGNPRDRLRYPRERGFWRWRTVGVENLKLPDDTPLERRRDYLCQPPKEKISGEGGSVRGKRLQSADTSPPPDEPLEGEVSAEGGRPPQLLSQPADTSLPGDEAPDEGVSPEGGGATQLQTHVADTSPSGDEASDVRRHNEEVLQERWRDTRCRRSWAELEKRLPYAVIALDKGQVEQLMEYWHKEGYPQKDNAKRDAANALSIVTAAQRKGQALLLTVEEAAGEDYKEHKEDKVNLYWNTYGRHPYYLRGHRYL